MTQTEIDNRNKYLNMVEQLKDIYFELNSWELEFVENTEGFLVDPDAILTERHANKLEEVYENHCS